MKVSEVIARMEAVAFNTKDDRLSNAILRVSDRLAHRGALFEKPLTVHERKVIAAFARVASK